MAKKTRKTAKKASSSLLMLLIIASAILAFIPFRITLAAGSLSSGLIGSCSTSGTTCATLLVLAGTHIAIDSLGLFAQTTLLTSFLTNLVGAATITPAIGSGLTTFDYLALKAQKITVDIDRSGNSTLTGLLLPFQNGPGLGAGPGTIQLRIVLLSVTISGYKLAGSVTNKYGEQALTGLNPALIISLDRAFIDLFIDPLTGINTYLVSADMTVYQGLALLVETATL